MILELKFRYVYEYLHGAFKAHSTIFITLYNVFAWINSMYNLINNIKSIFLKKKSITLYQSNFISF